MPGVVRTRVGYTGGRTDNPTYYHLGDHTETLQIDFDPTRVTYKQLLDVFWTTHNTCAQPGSRQYMSAVFYQGDAQKKLALETRDREAAKRGQAVTTAILPLGKFYVAEDYHQKYLLRQQTELMREFQAMYPDGKGFLVSTAAARVNGYLGGHGTQAALEREIGSLGLSPRGRQVLLEAWKGRH
jgi:peptide-methionine (S)-S-oxide reductase